MLLFVPKEIFPCRLFDWLMTSALKGFSPTPEFPGIAEAQTLLSAPAS
jgi:hypothetical protein